MHGYFVLRDVQENVDFSGSTTVYINSSCRYRYGLSNSQDQDLDT